MSGSTFICDLSAGLPVFNPGETASFELRARKAQKFVGMQNLKQAIQELTVEQVYAALKQHDANITPEQATQIYQAILEVQIQFVDQAATINTGEPLLRITGNPTAIAVLETTIKSTIGRTVGVGTYTSTLKDICDNNLALKGALFSGFGLRRGDSTDPIADQASLGFNSFANILAGIKSYFFPKDTMIKGTISHAFVGMYRSMYDEVMSKNNVQALYSWLQTVCDITSERYGTVLANPKLNIIDYIAFRAYIKNNKAIHAELGGDPPAIVLLVDTHNTSEGIRSAIQAAIDAGTPINGLRLDTSPAKYVKEAAFALAQARKDYPAIFGATRIFCTDGIDEKGLKEIGDIALAAKAEIEAQGLQMPLFAFGVGSSVVNEPTSEFDFVKLAAPNTSALSNDLNPGTPLSLRYVPQEHQAAYQADKQQREPFPFAADAYTILMARLLEKTNQFVGEYNRQNPTLNVQPFNDITAYMHIRYRGVGDPNHLLIAGMDKIIGMLTQDFNVDNFMQVLRDCKITLSADHEAKIRERIANNGGKLKISIAAPQDGDIIGPYGPVLRVSGYYEDVMLVESMITCIVGSQSSIATVARQVYDGMRLPKLSSAQALFDACLFYRLDPVRIANIHDDEELMLARLVADIRAGKEQVPLSSIANGNLEKFLNKYYAPNFAYGGADKQRSLTENTLYACGVAGFTNTTMNNTLGIPVIKPGISVDDFARLSISQQRELARNNQQLLIDLPKDLTQLVPTLANIRQYISTSRSGAGVQLQLRGDFPPEVEKQVAQILFAQGISLDYVTFIVREPIASATNGKGIVYKCSQCNGFDTLKPGGATEKVEEKSSLGGKPELVIIKDKNGVPIATVLCELPEGEASLVDVANELKTGALIYYTHPPLVDANQKLIIGKQPVDLSNKEFTLEPMLIETKQRNLSPQVSLEQARRRANENYSKGMDKLPELITPTYHNKQVVLIKKSHADESKVDKRQKMAGV